LDDVFAPRDPAIDEHDVRGAAVDHGLMGTNRDRPEPTSPISLWSSQQPAGAVMTAGRPRRTTLSTNGVQRVIEGATHMSLIVDEDGTGTTGAILDVVSSVRSARPVVSQVIRSASAGAHQTVLAPTVLTARRFRTNVSGGRSGVETQ
jgi:hypothetical protein